MRIETLKQHPWGAGNITAIWGGWGRPQLAPTSPLGLGHSPYLAALAAAFAAAAGAPAPGETVLKSQGLSLDPLLPLLPPNNRPYLRALQCQGWLLPQEGLQLLRHLLG